MNVQRVGAERGVLRIRSERSHAFEKRLIGGKPTPRSADGLEDLLNVCLCKAAERKMLPLIQWKAIFGFPILAAVTQTDNDAQVRSNLPVQIRPQFPGLHLVKPIQEKNAAFSQRLLQ